MMSWLSVISADMERALETSGGRDSLGLLTLIRLAIGVALVPLLGLPIAPINLLAKIAFTCFATLGLAELGV